MQGKHSIVILIVSIFAVVSACRGPNPYHCPDGELCVPDVLEGEQCGNIKCEAPMSVCKTDIGTCVECTLDRHCRVDAPRCDMSRNECAECLVHADCESELCLDDGTCADTAEVTYVSEQGVDNPMCLRTAPCENLEQALKPMALRKYIKASGRIIDDAVSVIDGKTVAIFGDPGRTSIERSTPDEVLEIKKDADVKVVDLKILGNNSSDKHCVRIHMPGGTGPNVTMRRVEVRDHRGTGAGIALSGGKLVMIDSQVFDNLGDGINATGGTLEIRRSLIHGNRGTAGVFTSSAGMVTIESSVIAKNTGLKAGLAISGNFAIRNSVIARNGGGSSLIGGLELSTLNGVFEFNTVANNVGGNSTAFSCTGARISNSILLTSNLIGALCDVEYSLTDVMGTPTGTNKIGEPMFRETMDHLSLTFYRIDQASAARDSADPAATIGTDIDGQSRSDARKDMGADEYN